MRVNITLSAEDVKFALTEYANTELGTYFEPAEMEVTLYKNGKAVIYEARPHSNEEQVDG